MSNGSRGITLLHSGYADDLYIVSRNVESLNENLARLYRVMEPVGIKLSIAKSKAIWLCGSSSGIVKLYNQPIELVNEFKYLGQVIDQTGAVSNEIAKRIHEGKIKLSKLKPIFRSNNIGIHRMQTY